ncbi:GerAB/ArcD/ProY family transporter [Paenibacillus flagellatus]|uniref:GerAB/ArcD/ProY family transporter n=1 Tax=Paenibacillus flagellatus TaxID=2211139 RepID=UPI0013053DB6|nr:GerAB/ArcD/ProY family transporter [Paenibacillus flagellatus]
MQRITQLQLGLMFILFHYSSATGFLIGPLTGVASYQGWAVLFASAAGGWAIGTAAAAAARRLPADDAGGRLGRWVHGAYSLLCGLFCLHLVAYNLREYDDFMVHFYLPNTPEWVISLLFGATISIAARSGLEAIARCGSGFFFITAASVLLLPPLVARELEYDRIVALATHWDASGMTKGIVKTTPWFGETFIVFFLLPQLREADKTARTLAWSLGCGAVALAIKFVLCMLLFGSDVTSHFTYPALELVRYIRLGDFLENLDPLMVAIWTTALFVKMSLLLYVVLLIASRLLRLRDHRPLSLSIGALAVGMSLHLASNSAELQHAFESSWAAFAYTVQLVPILYWAFLAWRKRNGGRPGGRRTNPGSA